MPTPPLPAGPGLSQQARKVGAPIGVIIALGIVSGLLVIALTAKHPVGTALGFTLATMAMSVVVLAYMWLDSWEPEPRRLSVFAFVWGASVAVVVSTFLEAYTGSVFDAPHTRSFVSVAIRAPFIEEAAKGLFLVLMMTGRRRSEINSLTECLVYAGLTGAGFAWVEDIGFIGNSQTVEGSLVVAGLRLVLGPFAHSLFTSMTAVGVYFALQQRRTLAKVLCVLAGYLGAVLVHGLWNSSSFLGFRAYLLVYIWCMVPIFAIMVAVAIRSIHQEQRIVTEKLPGMIEAGVVSANEATWLGAIKARKLAIAEATRIGGSAAGKSVKRFTAQVVDLAFVYDRIDHGSTEPSIYALRADEANGVRAARAAAPILATMADYRSPITPPYPY